jgi:hypothetical protein
MPRSYASLPGVSGMLLVILIASDRSLQSTAWQLNTNLEPSATGSTLHRRQAIERMVSGAAVLGGLGGGLGTVHAAVPSNGLTFDSYRVVPDSTAALNPSLLPIQVRTCPSLLSRGDPVSVLFLLLLFGEAPSHAFRSAIVVVLLLNSLYRRRIFCKQYRRATAEPCGWASTTTPSRTTICKSTFSAKCINSAKPPGPPQR